MLSEPSELIDSLAVGATKQVMEWLPRAVDDGKDMEKVTAYLPESSDTEDKIQQVHG